VLVKLRDLTDVDSLYAGSTKWTTRADPVGALGPVHLPVADSPVRWRVLVTLRR
jgi:hypothetical protein